MSAYNTQEDRIRQIQTEWEEVWRLKRELEAIRDFMARLETRRKQREELVTIGKD